MMNEKELERAAELAYLIGGALAPIHDPDKIVSIITAVLKIWCETHGVELTSVTELMAEVASEGSRLEFEKDGNS